MSSPLPPNRYNTRMDYRQPDGSVLSYQGITYLVNENPGSRDPHYMCHTTRGTVRLSGTDYYIAWNIGEKPHMHSMCCVSCREVLPATSVFLLPALDRSTTDFVVVCNVCKGLGIIASEAIEHYEDALLNLLDETGSGGRDIVKSSYDVYG